MAYGFNEDKSKGVIERKNYTGDPSLGESIELAPHETSATWITLSNARGNFMPFSCTVYAKRLGVYNTNGVIGVVSGIDIGSSSLRVRVDLYNTLSESVTVYSATIYGIEIS